MQYEIIKFDFCFFTIENYNLHIYKDYKIPVEDYDDWTETYDEFDTFWININ